MLQGEAPSPISRIAIFLLQAPSQNAINERDEEDRHPSGRRQGAAQHRAESERILAKIETYAAEPASQANNVKMLSGSSGKRLRVGNFRVIFEETETEMIVTKIGPRGSVYD